MGKEVQRSSGAASSEKSSGPALQPFGKSASTASLSGRAGEVQRQTEARVAKIEARLEGIAATTEAKFEQIEGAVGQVSAKQSSLESMMIQLASNQTGLQTTCTSLANSVDALRKDVVKALHPSPELTSGADASRSRTS